LREATRHRTLEDGGVDDYLEELGENLLVENEALALERLRRSKWHNKESRHDRLTQSRGRADAVIDWHANVWATPSPSVGDALPRVKIDPCAKPKAGSSLSETLDASAVMEDARARASKWVLPHISSRAAAGMITAHDLAREAVKPTAVDDGNTQEIYSDSESRMIDRQRVISRASFSALRTTVSSPSRVPGRPASLPREDVHLWLAREMANRFIADSRLKEQRLAYYLRFRSAE
jgi:hypothetical protein